MDLAPYALRAEPHREIGAVLKRDSSLIVDRWIKLAETQHPGAPRVHYAALRDALPEFIESVGRALEQSGPPTSTPRREAKAHGEQRWEHGWSLSELIRDYQLLRVALLDYLEDALKRPLLYREAMAVGIFIDDAVDASIGRYIEHRDAQQRTNDAERAAALEELSRRKDEFLAILGHELRNPLAPIRNSLEVVRKLVDSSHPAVAKSLEVLDRQSRQLGRLVDDLLDLARIGRGEFELRIERFDLRRAIDQALQVVDPLVKERNHRMSVALPANAIHVDADFARVTQIVGNLLSNAVKYTDADGYISLALHEDGGNAVIAVRDNGIGIAPEKLERVFELFARVHEPHSGRDGLGIGLALVQRLVQQHGGSISASSDGPGLGAQFEVRLPLRAREPLIVIEKVAR
ncbi:MAG TPA: HAMP domain-containing sensor histidine kinase [Burkholderiales bacterium]|nr:HAMP domain-containing sensor histidine kinase [Burkholderiales bacterium]